MKQYPSIRVADLDFSKSYYVFDKIDGSNVRVEWSKKAGFHKFGTRKVLLSENSIIAPAKDLVLAIGPELEKGMKELRVQQATFFFEFAGDESIAGQHRLMNDNKRVWLLDVDIYKQGMLDPKECLKHFEPLMPKLLHHGTVDQNFLDSVADRTLPGMTWEGVVGKAYGGRQKPLLMWKYKSRDWKDFVRAMYGDNCDAL